MSDGKEAPKSELSETSEQIADVRETTVEQHDETSGAGEVSAQTAGKQKIDVLLKATGNAPIMRKKKWAVDPDKKIGWIIEFIRKYLKLDKSESLFVYINQSFAPAPDNIVRNLYDCYGIDGKLVIYYCKSQAWG